MYCRHVLGGVSERFKWLYVLIRHSASCTYGKIHSDGVRRRSRVTVTTTSATVFLEHVILQGFIPFTPQRFASTVHYSYSLQLFPCSHRFLPAQGARLSSRGQGGRGAEGQGGRGAGVRGRSPSLYPLTEDVYADDDNRILT